MRGIPKNAQKVFSQVKSQTGMSVYQIAKSLGLDYKNAHNAVEFLEQWGFIASEHTVRNNKPCRLIRVPAELQGLDLVNVSIESGEKLMIQKESRRKAYFQAHDSVTIPNTPPLISLNKKSLKVW